MKLLLALSFLLHNVAAGPFGLNSRDSSEPIDGLMER